MSHTPGKRRTTRRGFLAESLAAMAAPYVLTGTAFGRSGRVAANDRITLGMIGVGNMGSVHLNAFLGDPEVQVLAIADVDARKREAAREKVHTQYGSAIASGDYSGCDLYNEYERVLERNDIDAVVIAVPDHWHAIIAIAACQAGKDVYCEKPLSLTVAEAGEMAAAARRYATVFQTGSQQRSSREFRHACELVRNGYIGDIKQVRVGIGGPSWPRYFPAQPVRDGFDWDRWLGPTPWYPYHSERCSGSYSGGWRLVRDYSGGMMTDWGAHHLDITQWGLGMDGSGPVEVIPPGESEHKTLTYRYDNGVEVLHGGANGVRFIGTEGSVEVNRGYLRTAPTDLEQVVISPREKRLYRSPGHRQDWLNCIRSRRRPICDVAIGASSVTVCHLGNIAWWLGRSLRWDPHQREIIGDRYAAEWLDRPKRAPYRLHA